MTNTFELKKGKLVFEEDKITITDNIRNQKNSRLLSAGLFFLFAGLNLFNFVNHDNVHKLWTGILFGIGGIFMLFSFFRMDASSEIFLKDVKSLKLKRVLFREFLIIKLSNNKTRRVAEIFNPERLEEFIKTISLPQ